MRAPLRKPAKSSIGTARKAALWQNAYAHLKRAIIGQELRPGEVLSISELARFLGVSRTPTKEALSRLERDHLVELIPHQGVKIRELSLDEVIHILNLREALDGLAARLAAGRVDVARLDHFEQEFRRLAAGDHSNNADRQAKLSRELHEAVIAIANNPYLEATWRSLITSFERVSSHGWRTLQDKPSSQQVHARRCKEHIDIIRALRQGDQERAERAARLHVANALSDIITVRSGVQEASKARAVRPGGRTKKAAADLRRITSGGQG